MLRYRLAREPAMAGPETRLRSGLVAGLPALVGGAIMVLFGLVGLLEVAVIVSGPSADCFARPQDSSIAVDYVDHRIAHGIGLDLVVYLVGAVAMLTVGASLWQRGVYRLAGMRRRRAVPAPRNPRRSAVLYAASRMLLGGISLLSAVILVGFAVLKVQCNQRTAGSMPGWLPAAWFNKVAVDCKAAYPDGVNGGALLFDLVLFTALLIVAVPMLRRGIVATRQVFARPSAKPAIARPEPAEQIS